MSRQKRLITSLEVISKISEEFLNNIVEDSIYTDKNLELYNLAKGKQKIEKGLFLTIEESLEVIEEAGKDLSEAEKTRMKKQIIKYNLMVLAHNLTHRENLLLCCTNFFIGVIGSNADYTEKDIEFYLNLREHALRSELVNIKESGGKFDLSDKIWNYFPAVEKKYYFYDKKSPSLLDKVVFKKAEKKRGQILGQEKNKLADGFYKEMLNDELISFVKRKLNITAGNPASSSPTLSSPVLSGEKRSEIPDEEDSRAVKKTKTSIFDSREDARKINKYEVFDPELVSITPSETSINENEIEEDQLDRSDEENEFHDASPTLQETTSQTGSNRAMSIEVETTTSTTISHNFSNLEVVTIDDSEDEEEPATQSRAQSESQPESQKKPLDSDGSEDDSTYAPDEPQGSTSERQGSSGYSATVRDRCQPRYPDPEQKREERRDNKPPGTKQKLRATPTPWTQDEVDALEEGLRQVKRPDWVKIIKDSNGRLKNRTNVQCKDKAKTELKKLARLGYTEERDLGPYRYVKFPKAG